jgi:hypothetical protein
MIFTMRRRRARRQVEAYLRLALKAYREDKDTRSVLFYLKHAARWQEELERL